MKQVEESSPNTQNILDSTKEIRCHKFEDLPLILMRGTLWCVVIVTPGSPQLTQFDYFVFFKDLEKLTRDLKETNQVTCYTALQHWTMVDDESKERRQTKC